MRNVSTDVVAGVFLDSSALVKLVRPERETDALRRFLAEPRRPLVISELGVTEVTRAARRVGLDPTEALAECEVVLLRSDDLARASELIPTTLRTLDAIQLAVAVSLIGDIEAFIAYDTRLLAAAEAHGLPTAAPA